MRVGVCSGVDCDELHVVTVLDQPSQYSTDTTKAIYTNTYSHDEKEKTNKGDVLVCVVVRLVCIAVSLCLQYVSRISCVSQYTEIVEHDLSDYPINVRSNSTPSSLNVWYTPPIVTAVVPGCDVMISRSAMSASISSGRSNARGRSVLLSSSVMIPAVVSLSSAVSTIVCCVCCVSGMGGEGGSACLFVLGGGTAV